MSFSNVKLIVQVEPTIISLVTLLRVQLVYSKEIFFILLFVNKKNIPIDINNIPIVIKVLNTVDAVNIGCHACNFCCCQLLPKVHK